MKLLVIVITFFLSACDLSRGSPFSDESLREERDLNTSQDIDTTAIEADGIIRIAVITDTHQSYQQFQEVVDQINSHENIDFVAHLGDMSHHGHATEYDQFLNFLTQIKFPTFVAIGNHDATEIGFKMFRKIFGPTNFWFESTSYRFVFFNSNNRETPGDFSPQWLIDTVTQTAKKVFVFSHVPIRGNRFPDSMFDPVFQAPNFQATVHGHHHRYRLSENMGAVVLGSPPMEVTEWLLLEIQNDFLCINRMKTEEQTCVQLKI